MTSSLDMIRGRQFVQPLTNQSGGGVIAGDVVIVSAANDESFTTTTSAAYNSTRVGVAQESIAAAATGRVLLEGYAPLVNVSASATRGHYLLTHTVAKQATSQAGYAAGAFGQIIKAGTTPSAVIFPVAQVGSAGVARSGSTTDEHLAVWNGSDADSLKDGGVVSPAGLTLLGSAYDASTRAHTADNTWEDVTNTSVTFTAAGNENVIVEVDLQWGFTSANWGHHVVRLLLGSATTGVTPDSWIIWTQNSNPDTTITHQNHVVFVVAATAGSNTVKLQTFDNGANVNRTIQKTLVIVTGQ